MKSYFFVSILFVAIVVQFNCAQNFKDKQSQSGQDSKSKLTLDRDYFLLGTLSDYLGREKTYRNNDFVDNYYKGEYLLMKYIIKIYNDEVTDFVVEKNQYPYNSVEDILRSKIIAQKMNAFYDFKFEGGFKSFIDPKDKEWRKKQLEYFKSNEPKDTVYTGTIKADIFKTNLQRISFIVGAYSRYGVPNKTRCCMIMFNSESKFKYCETVLKQLKCKDIEKKIVENIPTNQYLYFKPSSELKKYFEEYSFLNKFVGVNF